VSQRSDLPTYCYIMPISLDQYRVSSGQFYSLAIRTRHILSLFEYQLINMLIFRAVKFLPCLIILHFLCNDLVGRSGYFLKQGIFIYKYDSCVDFFNTITEQFSFWESDKWFKSYARFKYRNLLLNFIQDGHHLCCIYGQIQCRLLVKDRILHFAWRLFFGFFKGTCFSIGIVCLLFKKIGQFPG
jgi:hypothetical protein